MKLDIEYALSKSLRKRLRKSVTKHFNIKKVLNSAMDDSTTFAPAVKSPKNEVILGVYGSEDWVCADFLRARYLAGKKTLETRDTWITSATFKLSDWVVKMGFEAFTFFNHTKVIIPASDGLMMIDASRGKIHASFTGDVEFCQKWEAVFDKTFRRAENLIEWVYNGRGDVISVPLNFRPAIQTAYPWIDRPINDYINDYLNSDANVLILIGPPGTGKTTFIKNLIHMSKANAKVAYDEKILAGDDFFAGFIEDDCRFLIMEDADNFLDSRQDGNTMMHKFLNVSDGLISAADKKLVFSTNLPNVSDIDSALLREGRCFDVLKFRPLTRKEAQAVLDEVGDQSALPDKSEITLAELFNRQPSNTKQSSIGFI